MQILFLLSMEPSLPATFHTEARDNITSTEDLPHLHRFITKPSQQEKVFWIYASYIHLLAECVLLYSRNVPKPFQATNAIPLAPETPPEKAVERQLSWDRESGLS